MVKAFNVAESQPYPNNSLPVLYYENALGEALGEAYTADEVLTFFENNGYTNGWKGGVKDRHHFHSTAHEVLACTKGKVTVQLGGPNGDLHTFRRGDVVLLPAGVSHKRVKAIQGFEIVGAYPAEASDYDFQYDDVADYQAIKENIQNVPKPVTDPVTGSPGNIDEYWS